MLNKTFQTLRTLDYGPDVKALTAEIDAAIAKTKDDPKAGKAIEEGLPYQSLISTSSCCSPLQNPFSQHLSQVAAIGRRGVDIAGWVDIGGGGSFGGGLDGF